MDNAPAESDRPLPAFGASPRAQGEGVFNLILLTAALVLAHQAWSIAGFRSLSSAGVFPMLAAGTMVVTAASILLQSVRSRAERKGERLRFFGDVVSFRIVVFAALIVAYMLALQPLGFIAASFLFLSTSMMLLYRHRPFAALLLSALSVAVIYGLFRYVFVVVLPRGTFF
jgi:putative tricarboxylic transport membrane protein